MNLTKNDLTSLIPLGAVDCNLNNISFKDEAISYLSNLLFSCGMIQSEREFQRAVLERERLGETLLNNMLAIPHAVSGCVISPGMAFGLSQEGILYGGKSTSEYAKAIFLMALPKNKKKYRKELEVLKRITCLFLDPIFNECLLAISNYEELINLVRETLVKHTDIRFPVNAPAERR